MGVSVLVCGCGQRVKAPGAVPGRVGRCPRCGAPLTVPDAQPVASEADRSEPEPAGYYLGAEVVRAGRGSVHRRATVLPDAAKRRARQGVSPQRVEGRGSAAWLYPLQGAEGVTVVLAMGIAFWALAALVPEYCLSVLRDAEAMGTPSMGRLVALISSLPALILALPVGCYALQYLGRVLVASAAGDSRPPRPPDRNCDGFLNGLSPWLLWLVAGAGVGALPLLGYALARGDGGPIQPLVAFGLIAFGMPYALVALMMLFLHDDAFAARPAAVVAAIARLGPSFLGVSLGVAGAFGLVVLAFRGALRLRESHFGIYLAAALGCWLFAHWVAIVVMRVLGLAYYRRRKGLRWHRERPRWGVAWGL